MIIDFHTHVFPEKIASATVSALAKRANIPPYTDGTEAGLLHALSEARADVAVNLPVLTKPTQFESVTSFAREINEKSYTGACKIISFAGMHPDVSDVEERMHELRLMGFRGIKLHPDYQGTFFDDEKYVRIVAAAKAEGLIVVTHSGLDAAYVGETIKCTPKRVLRLLDRIGGYSRLVLAHYGANALFDEVYSLLAGEDVYFDTAYILHSIGEEQFKRILDKHGSDRILFATDSPWQNIAREVEIIKEFKLGDESEERIFSLNARKLLGI